jgi:hypothetical protein
MQLCQAVDTMHRCRFLAAPGGNRPCRYQGAEESKMKVAPRPGLKGRGRADWESDLKQYIPAVNGRKRRRWRASLVLDGRELSGATSGESPERHERIQCVRERHSVR